jgi:hypothetical protein
VSSKVRIAEPQVAASPNLSRRKEGVLDNRDAITSVNITRIDKRNMFFFLVLNTRTLFIDKNFRLE